MTARKKRPMPRAEIVRLGGLAVSQNREHMRRIGELGQEATQARYGGDQLRRAQLRAHGYDVPTLAPTAHKETAVVAAVSKSPEGVNQ